MYYHFRLDRHDDVRDNNAFFVEIVFTLKAIKCSFERLNDKANVTLEAFHMTFIKLAECSFDKSHMK